MSTRMAGWVCIGCGRIEVPQDCLGVCEDRPVQVVLSSDYDEAAARAELEGERAAALAGLVRRLASVSPRDGEWERSFRAFQSEARGVLRSLPKAE